jgi:hypothetical protein
MQPDPSDRPPTDVPEPTNFEEAMGYLVRTRQQLAHANSELEKTRKESAGYRVGAKGQLAVASRKISALLGEPVADDQEPPDIDSLITKLDPSKHATALKAKDGEIRGLKLRATLAEKFHSLGMKPGITRAALIDQGHMEKLSAAVDAPDFDEQVSTVLEELAVDIPEVRGSGPIPTRSSAPMRHTVNVDEQFGIEEVNAMTPEQVQEALSRGKLDKLLNRRS